MSEPATPAFLGQTNIYEVNLRQYSADGTIQSFIKHLPRLHEMGVEILWIMPIHPIGIFNRKGTLGSYYSIKDYCAINPEFGTLHDFKILVEAVHVYGMKIIIDWVANHTAWDHVWTFTNPEFFIHDQDGNFKPPYDWTDVIQINHSSEAQQQAMIDAMKFWVEKYNIDGFRADLAHLTPLVFWINARQALSEIKPDLVWLAETEDTNYYEAFDIMYAWKWMHATEDFFKQEQRITVPVNLLITQENEFPSNALQLYFTSNHDENSWNGTEYEKYKIYAKALAVFNYTYPGSVPLIYSGQELPNYKRLKFFEKDAIEWTENIELHSFYKTLLAFHKNNFTGGELEFLPNEKNILAFSRLTTEIHVIVFLNLDKEQVTIDLKDNGYEGIYKNIFSGENMMIDKNFNFVLQPGDFLVLNKVN